MIILDLGLPDLDGLEVLKRLREWSRIPVIILSVREQENDKILALDAGADDYVTKPFSMGELLARESEFEKAAGYYRKAVSLSPNDPDAHYNLGVCLVNLGQSEEAQCHFQKAVELKPDYAEAYFQLGSIYISQNKKEEAIASLEKFIELAPQHEKAALARQLLEYLKK